MTGYEEKWQDESFNGQFLITKIDEYGFTMDNTDRFDEDTAFQLAYIDEYDTDAGSWTGGYWFDFVKFEPITTENDKVFTFGEGLFVSSPEPLDGEEIKLVTAGQVAGEDNTFPLRYGFNLIGNPMPVDINVTDVKVAGYEEKWQDESFNGQVLVTKIDEYGFTMDNTDRFDEDTAFQLAYIDEYDTDAGSWTGGYWFDFVKFEPIEPETGIVFKAGEGLWFSAPEPLDGETITVEFPSPLVKHDAEPAE